MQQKAQSPGGAGSQARPGQPLPPPDSRPERRFRHFLPVLAVVTVTVLVALGVGFGAMRLLAGVFGDWPSTLSSSVPSPSPVVQGTVPQATAYNFYQALAIGRYEDSRALLAPGMASQYTAADLQAKWKALQAGAGKLLGGTSGSPTINGNQATLVEELSTAGGRTYKVNLSLEQANGTWRITGAEPGLVPSP